MLKSCNKFIFYQKIATLFTLIIALASCGGQKEEAQRAALKLKADSLQQGLAQAWTKMINSDDRKNQNIGRLLQEFSYVNVYDSLKRDSLLAKQKTLLDQRYDQHTMAESALIDRYDLASDDLLRNVRALVDSTPEIKNYQVVNQLMSEIQAADDSIIIYRHNYDGWVDAWNNFMEKNDKEKLAKAGVPDSALKKRAVFRLIQ